MKLRNKALALLTLDLINDLISGSRTVHTLSSSYQINRGCIVLPKSVTPSRTEENLKVIHIAGEDMEVLESMAANGKLQRVNTPLWGHDLVSQS